MFIVTCIYLLGIFGVANVWIFFIFFLDDFPRVSNYYKMPGELNVYRIMCVPIICLN